MKILGILLVSLASGMYLAAVVDPPTLSFPGFLYGAVAGLLLGVGLLLVRQRDQMQA